MITTRSKYTNQQPTTSPRPAVTPSSCKRKATMNKTFMAAAREFFGLKPGQTPIQFGQEIKALTPQDRADLTPGLEAALDCTIVASAV